MNNKIDTSSFEATWGEPPDPSYRGCWHVEIDGKKIRRLWGWWPKVRQELEMWIKSGHQVRLLGSSVEKV